MTDARHQAFINAGVIRGIRAMPSPSLRLPCLPTPTGNCGLPPHQGPEVCE